MSHKNVLLKLSKLPLQVILYKAKSQEYFTEIVKATLTGKFIQS